jgi:plastocyanin
MTRTLSVLAVAGATLALAAPASTSTGSSLIIRHQLRGCHSWSYNGGAYKVSQVVTLKQGARLSIANNDIMPHKLVKVSGPKMQLPASANMNHMGATTQIAFTKAGVYKFTTKPGEDYANMRMMKTIGEDNVLRLTVTVR